MKKNTNQVYGGVRKQASKILFLVTLSFILMSVSPVKASDNVQAQQATITGKVTDSFTGKPIMNVVVSVKDSKTIVKTDKDGAFSLVLPKGGKALLFTLSGYEPLEVAIGDKTTFVIEMTAVAIDPSLW
jgi:hypothetical protein